MVRGLDLFKEHFKDYEDQYILIGGTACSIAFEKAGVPFRSTQDMDIVLTIEVLSSEFGKAMWSFIQQAQYQNKQINTGKCVFYRFQLPVDRNYPSMIELFSRKPDLLVLEDHSHLTPIPFDEDISSLSAILLDTEYYEFIQAGKYADDGLSLLKPEYILVLKAKAWLDLTSRKNGGVSISEQDIKKHRNDVFRLFLITDPQEIVTLSDLIKGDLKMFLNRMTLDNSIDLINLGLKGISKEEIINRLGEMYKLEL